MTGEEDGRDYHFVSRCHSLFCRVGLSSLVTFGSLFQYTTNNILFREKMEEIQKNGGFLENAEFSGETSFSPSYMFSPPIFSPPYILTHVSSFYQYFPHRPTFAMHQFPSILPTLPLPILDLRQYVWNNNSSGSRCS